MKNGLFTLIPAIAIGFLASGCIFVIDDTQHHAQHDSYDHDYHDDLPWFDDARVYCEYDSHYDESRWQFNALVDSYYGYDDIYLIQINVYGVNDHISNTYNLWEDAYGHWSLNLWSSNIYCGHAYDIEFVAYDSAGSWANLWVQW